jgi:archaemetzincin
VQDAKQFNRPGKEARRQAIGSLEHLPANVRRFLDPSHFEPIAAPGPWDWLAVHPEAGQTSGQFLRSRPNFPGQTRRTIYLQPLEEFPADGPALPRLKAFTEAFFSMEVQVLPVAPHVLDKITTRVNSSTHQVQLFTQDILDLLKQRLPRNAYCLLGITLRDLYPDPKWNFVFGEASLNDRVGVYSFARYDPRFSGEDAPDRVRLMLRRSCKVLAHETGHMFGIGHCIYFRCVMNGSNNLPEEDSQPMHLCPVDLRKLYESVRFDPVARYAHLRDFCREVGFSDEADWIDQQLLAVRS